MATRAPTLADLRCYAVARTLFSPTTLPRAIARLGFVQADPIRAPARAQDLILRHRVRDYRAGELERRYAELDIEEDFFINYGFLPRATHQLMHPRAPRKRWTKSRAAKAAAVLDFVRERGVAHPSEVDAHFQHGKVRSWGAGSSNASTKLLDDMHYRGLIRIAGRASGVRLYTVRAVTPPVEDVPAAMDALIDVIVRKYAPMPDRSLTQLAYHLRAGAPQWARQHRAALERARKRLPWAEIDGVRWFWVEGENPRSTRWAARSSDNAAVRLFAPFDPVVWDRRRFEMLWNWAYRFEAYTPAAKRVRGYYALPLLWRDAVIGWGNLSVAANRLSAQVGFQSGKPPRDAAFKRALDEEIERVRVFLGVG
jgi:uncharacterized protein YcaQ